jgi:integrase
MPRRNQGARLQYLEKRDSYYIVWYEGGRQRLRATGTQDSELAQDALIEFIRQQRLAAKPDAPKDPSELSIADMLEIYAANHAPSVAAPARIGYAIDALLPFWGDLEVSRVTPSTCRAYAKQRGKAPATIRRELATLQAALNYAVKDQRMTRAPRVTLPNKPAGKDRWLTRREAAGLLNAARTGRADVRLYLPLFIALGLYTGARKEAILSLRWSQVDMDRQRIDYRNQSVTNKRRAHIPIPRPLMTLLRLARDRGADDGFVIHDKGRRILDVGDATNGSFGGACKRAGLTSVSPHVLRHTCGTWLAQAGVDLHKIGWWLGHSDHRTTQLYAHHHPDYQEDAREALESRNASRTKGVQKGVARTITRTRSDDNDGKAS